jgi:hypothetical protein
VRLLVRHTEGRERGIAASAFVRVAAHGERPDQVIEAGVERTLILGRLRTATVLSATVLAATGRAHLSTFSISWMRGSSESVRSPR